MLDQTITPPTAAQILSSWDQTKGVMSKCSAWLILLRIAAKGTEGITISELRDQHFSVPDRRLLRKYAAAGLLDIQANHATHGANAHLHPRYFITAKGYRFLRLSPTPRTLTLTSSHS